MSESPHTVSTLKDLLDERDRRYSEQRKSDQEAVRLAKEVADKARGTVGIVGLVSAVALIVSLADKFK